jgi:hypothetical protein
VADSPVFDAVAEALGTRGALDSLAARGTLRLALKSAGLEAKTVTGTQMVVVLERVLPGELERRGVSRAKEVCAALAPIARATRDSGGAAGGAAPEDVFRRIRG